jgi:alpha-tubulin suppressor-like RCC1 family protein
MTATVAGLEPVVFEAIAAVGPPAALEIMSGNQQTGPVGQLLAAPLVLRVKDALGNGVPGVRVDFSTPAGGAFAGTGVSDATGAITARWALGQKSGTQAARAAVAGSAVVADLTATAQPGPAASLTILSGDGQTGPAGQMLPLEIRVTARDAFGNPVGPGTVVTFSPSQGSTVSNVQAATDASGAAGTRWTLRPSAGMNATTASLAGGAAVVFSATGLAGVPARMVAVSGDGQTGGIGSVLAPLVVQVLDADANPVGAGIEVRFSATDGALDPAVSVTDASGTVSTTWTLGLITGRQSVRATLGGNPAVVLQFDATVTAGPPANIALVSGNNQSALPGQALAAPLVVRVTDGAGNLVAGAAVSFAVTAGGGSVSPATATTNAAGTASAAWTLGLAGTQSVTATLTGVPGQVVSFTATLSVGPPAQISIVSGNAQTGDAGSALAASIVIQVLDAANAPVPGVTVDFATGAGSGAISPASPATDAAGQVSGTWTLGVFPGSNTGTATVSGQPALTVNLSATGDAPPFASITLGFQACGIASVAFCWGPNPFGGLGDGTTTDRSQPTLVGGGIAFDPVIAGDEHSCALAGTTAYCWGLNDGGQVGDGTNTHRSLPTLVAGGLSFTRLAAFLHTCGITTGGQAYCWGNNTNGKLGDGTTTNRNVPTAVSGGLTFTRISVGFNHTCALTAAGAAWCWGGNGFGQVGDGTTTHRSVPTPVLGGITFQSITAGGAHSCGLTAAGQAYCWGANANGQLGNGNNTGSPTPVAVAGGHTFTAIEAGASDHVCGLASGSAWCWGGNASGQLGDGTTTARNVPTAVSGGHPFVDIQAGYLFTCGATTTAVWCWGSNFGGRLGNGVSGVDSLVPVAVILP